MQRRLVSVHLPRHMYACAYRIQADATALLSTLSYTIPHFDYNIVKLKPFVNVNFL